MPEPFPIPCPPGAFTLLPNEDSGNGEGGGNTGGGCESNTTGGTPELEEEARPGSHNPEDEEPGEGDEKEGGYDEDLLPQARELSEAALESGNADAQQALDFIDDLLARKEHTWIAGGSLAGK